MAERPIGVSIIGMLQILLSLLLIITGGLSLMAGLLFLYVPVLGIVLVGLAIFMLIWGIIGLYIGFGLWNMKNWAYLVAMIFNIIAILIGIVNVILGDLTGILSLILPLIIVIYLYTVRGRFR